jgi:lipopolysaccharide export system protein LptA
MRNRVERLRIWLLGSAIFLMLVIAAFLGYARHLSRHRFSLPARLGMNIVREADGYTYSQWDDAKKRTLFTIHAAKEVEYTDKKITLHDVSITMYGENQDRNDRIYGDDFEYDQKAEVFRSSGLVHIDLQAAQAARASGEKVASSAASAAKMLHVTTSGLVYIKSLGVAATSERLEFQSGGMTGQAMGADYSSDTGLLMLHSAVSMSGRSGKRPVEVTGATAQLDNRNQEILLTRAKYTSQGQTMEAQQATLHTRPDGTLARVEAEGSVTIQANGAKVDSGRADVTLNAKSQPQSAALTGGVQYSADKPLLQRSGQAESATIDFDAQGQAQHAEFTGAVHMGDRTRATEAANEPWSTHDLTAAKVEATLATVSGGAAQVRNVVATGSARLAELNNGTLANSKDKGRTEISADTLTAHLIDAANGKHPPQLDTVAGQGHTLLHQMTADGVEQTSAGDSLDAKFRPTRTVVGGTSHSGAGSPAGVEGVNALLRADQQGHVSMMRRAPARSGAKVGANAESAQQDVERATAERAAYDGDLDRVTLTGGVQMSDGDSVLWANQVALDHATGDVHATGTVKVNYLQDGSAQGSGTPAAQAESTHILAERGELQHASGLATFYGGPARLWQGGSQVQAPVIEFARKQQRLTARGEASTGGASGTQAAQVHTVLASAGDDRPGAANSATSKPNAPKKEAGKAGPESPMPSVVRIASNRLVYSEDLRQAEFSGGVRAETVNGAIHASEATVYLQQSAGQAAASRGASAMAVASTEEAVPSLAGSVERMVATGQIEIEQPGRRATGERLEYTASDQLFVLTGECKVQPRLVDATRGTVTGAVLRFHTGDDSVVVSKGLACATGDTPSGRVRAETDAGKDATIGKGK